MRWAICVDCELRSCEWTHFTPSVAQVSAAVAEGGARRCPWVFLGASGSAAAQLACARDVHRRPLSAAATPLWRGERYRHDRIRVAYLSADFHEHATAHLIAELFEVHDAARFELTAVSFGPETNDPMRERLRRAFPRFVDVRGAQRPRRRRDAARVGNRHRGRPRTDSPRNSRTGILALRPAPVQVNYLGYPGTMGAPYIDYIIADRA